MMMQRRIPKEIVEAAEKNRKSYIKSIKDEYQLLQNKIDKYGESSLRYKQFAISVALALGYFAVKEQSIWIPLLGALVSLVFMLHEAVNSIYLNILIRRAFLLERGIVNPFIRKQIHSPYISHYFSSEKGTFSGLSIKDLIENWTVYIIYLVMTVSFIAIFTHNLYARF